MALEPTPAAAPTPDPAAPPAAVPANPAPSLLATPPAADPGTAPQPQQLTPEQQAAADKAAAESKTRTDAWSVAATPEGKKAAYEALNAEEKKAAYDKLSAEDRKALALADPSRPTYTAFTLPDGLAVDGPAMKAASDLFADSGLTQEQAQKFIDLATSREQAAAQKSVQAFVDMQTKWVSEIKADPEIGGDKLQASLASSARLIDRLAIPGLREALDLTGAGNNPAIVRAFARLGQMISEDRFAPGNGAPPAAAKSPAEAIYGAQPKGEAA